MTLEEAGRDAVNVATAGGSKHTIVMVCDDSGAFYVAWGTPGLANAGLLEMGAAACRADWARGQHVAGPTLTIVPNGKKKKK
jgi:hypothetical protein